MRALLALLCLLITGAHTWADGTAMISRSRFRAVIAEISTNHPTQEAAYWAARDRCDAQDRESDCQVLKHFRNTCVAIAVSDYADALLYGIGEGNTEALAAQNARADCAQSSPSRSRCTIRASACDTYRAEPVTTTQQTAQAPVASPAPPAVQQQQGPRPVTPDAAWQRFKDSHDVYFPWLRYVPYFYYALGAGVLLVIIAVLAHAAKRRRERAETTSRFNRRPMYDHSPLPNTPRYAETQPVRQDPGPVAPPPERPQTPPREYLQSPPPIYPEKPPREYPSKPPPTYPETPPPEPPKRLSIRDAHAEMREKILGPRQPVERRSPEVAEAGQRSTTIVRSQTYEI